MGTSAEVIRFFRQRTNKIKEKKSLQEAFEYLFTLLDSFEENSESDQKKIDHATMIIDKIILNIKPIERVL